MACGVQPMSAGRPPAPLIKAPGALSSELGCSHCTGSLGGGPASQLSDCKPVAKHTAGGFTDRRATRAWAGRACRPPGMCTAVLCSAAWLCYLLRVHRSLQVDRISSTAVFCGAWATQRWCTRCVNKPGGVMLPRLRCMWPAGQPYRAAAGLSKPCKRWPGSSGQARTRSHAQSTPGLRPAGTRSGKLHTPQGESHSLTASQTGDAAVPASVPAARLQASQAGWAMIPCAVRAWSLACWHMLWPAPRLSG